MLPNKLPQKYFFGRMKIQRNYFYMGIKTYCKKKVTFDLGEVLSHSFNTC